MYAINCFELLGRARPTIKKNLKRNNFYRKEYSITLNNDIQFV